MVLWCNGANGNDRHTQSLPGYQISWTEVSVVCQGCHMINASMMPLIGTQESVSQSLHSCQGIFSHILITAFETVLPNNQKIMTFYVST